MLFLNKYPYGLCKMSLAKSGIAIDHQRIEGSASGIVADRYASRTRKPVAFPLYIVAEVVVGIELRIKVHLLDPRYYKRILY